MRRHSLLFALAFIGAINHGQLIPAAEGHSVHRSDSDYGAEIALSSEIDACAEGPAEVHAEQDLGVAIASASRYADLARENGDPSCSDHARAILAPWWDLQQPPVAVRLLRATLRQQRHEFDRALSDIDAALEAAPSHPQAWLSKAMIHTVQGQPEEAAYACSKLPRNTSRLAVAGCYGHVGRLTGQADKAYQFIKASMRARSPASAELQGWLLTIMAEISVQLGQNERAEQHFLDAMAMGHADPYLLAAYSDMLLDSDRPADVVTLLAQKKNVDVLLLRFAIAERQLDLADAAGDIARLRHRFAVDERESGSLHGRELSRFALELLDRPDQALDLALMNWANQREPADARLVLEAALAANAPDAARSVLDWMSETKIEHDKLRSLEARVRERMASSS